MKKIVLLFVATFAAALMAVADEDGWLTDFSKAQELARKEKRAILMDFTGSDWCPPCKALHKNVFTSKEFKDFAKEKLVLLVVDFPNKELPPEQKKANNELAGKYKVGSFPTIIVLSSEGKKVGSIEGYRQETAKEYIAKVKKLTDKAS